MAKKKKLTEIELKIKQYTPPEINYKFHRTVSYSQYSIYASCPHKWYLTYVENKAPYQSSIHYLKKHALMNAMKYTENNSIKKLMKEKN